MTLNIAHVYGKQMFKYETNSLSHKCKFYYWYYAIYRNINMYYMMLAINSNNNYLIYSINNCLNTSECAPFFVKSVMVDRCTIQWSVEFSTFYTRNRLQIIHFCPQYLTDLLTLGSTVYSLMGTNSLCKPSWISNLLIIHQGYTKEITTLSDLN